MTQFGQVISYYRQVFFVPNMPLGQWLRCLMLTPEFYLPLRIYKYILLLSKHFLILVHPYINSERQELSSHPIWPPMGFTFFQIWADGILCHNLVTSLFCQNSTFKHFRLELAIVSKQRWVVSHFIKRGGGVDFSTICVWRMTFNSSAIHSLCVAPGTHYS